MNMEVNLSNEIVIIQILASLLSPIIFILIVYGKSIGERITYMLAPRILMKRLKKMTGMSIILFASEVGIKEANKLDAILRKIEKKGIKEIMLILDTFGGYEFAMSRITTSIKNFKGIVHCYIPRYAMSAGSFIAFSCKDIYMSDKSSLGPMDVQLGTLFWVYSNRAWQEIIKKKGVKAKDDSIAMAFYGKQYTKMFRKHLDSLESLKGKDKFKDMVVSGDMPHSAQLDKQFFISSGISIKDIDYNEVFEIVEKNPSGIRVEV